jgi:hypothetical protein
MKRMTLLLGALSVAAALVLFSDPPPDRSATVVEPMARRGARAAEPDTRREAAATIPLRSLIAREVLYPAVTKEGGRDLFAARVPTPPVAPASAPATPALPDFPFQYVGRKHEGARWEVFLTKGEFSFIAREGETFSTDYRIDKIAPPVMTVTYLPMQQSQMVPIGNAD